MQTKINKHLFTLGLTGLALLAIFAVPIGPSQLPFAQVAGDDEETQEECPPEECGGEEDTEPIQTGKQTTTTPSTTSPTQPATTEKTTETQAPATEAPQSSSATTPALPTRRLYGVPQTAPKDCKEDTWTCTGWGSCSDTNDQWRRCYRSADCQGVDTPSPSIKQACSKAGITPLPEEKPKLVLPPRITLPGRPVLNPTPTEPTLPRRPIIIPMPKPVPSDPQPIPEEPKKCTQDKWSCTEWSLCRAVECLDSRNCPAPNQFKVCRLIEDCEGVNTPAPTMRQSCTPGSIAKPTPLPPRTTPLPPVEAEETEEDEEEVIDDENAVDEISFESEANEAGEEAARLEDKAGEAAEEAARLEIERRAAEEAAARATEETARLKAEHQAAEEAATRETATSGDTTTDEAKQRQERATAEEAVRLEAEQQRAAEEAAHAEAERLTQEKAHAEEEALRLAEESARKKAEEERLRQEHEALAAAKEIQDAIEETPAFREAVASAPSSAESAPILNLRKLEEEAGADLKEIENETVKEEAKLILQVRNMVAGGSLSQAKAKEVIFKERKKIKRKKVALTIKKIAKKKYKRDIKDSKQDTNNDGSSDEVAVALGVDPAETLSASASFTPVEKKIYRTGRRITKNIRTGDKLTEKGFTALVSCPADEKIDLTAIDSKGNRKVLETKNCSSNGKAVFTLAKGALKKGKYVFLASRSNTVAERFPLFASVLDTALGETSEPAVVDIVNEISVPEPVVESIEGMNISGIGDIRVSTGEDGRVTVSGSSDVDTMVIGTFESAVFTSAILSDIENGRFEITSSRPLETGAHDVVIYATRPDENSQSPPVKIRFSIIPTAVAAPLENDLLPPSDPIPPWVHQTAKEKSSPLLPVAAGAFVVVLLIGIGVVMRKKNPGA